jgi:hypothetical protein
MLLLLRLHHLLLDLRINADDTLVNRHGLPWTPGDHGLLLVLQQPLLLLCKWYVLGLRASCTSGVLWLAMLLLMHLLLLLLMLMLLRQLLGGELVRSHRVMLLLLLLTRVECTLTGALLRSGGSRRSSGSGLVMLHAGDRLRSCVEVG